MNREELVPDFVLLDCDMPFSLPFEFDEEGQSRSGEHVDKGLGVRPLLEVVSRALPFVVL